MEKFFIISGGRRDDYPGVLAGSWGMLVPLAYFLLLLVPGVCLLRSATITRRSRYLLGGLYAGVLGHHLQHLFYLNSSGFFGAWHLLPEFLTALAGLTILLDRFGQVVMKVIETCLSVFSRGSRPYPSGAGFFPLVLLILLYAAAVYSGLDRLGTAVYETRWNQDAESCPNLLAAGYIRARFAPGIRFGAFNAGVTAFFAERTVVNLDGLVNSAGYQRDWLLQKRPLVDYLVQENIDYLVDMKREMKNGPRYHFTPEQFETVVEFGTDEELKFALWKVKTTR